MTKKPNPTELKARTEAFIRQRNERIAELRQRSGLSMDELAKLMGFKGQSGIQRYLNPTYEKGFRPELAARFKAALVGRGNPPITPRDLLVFDVLVEDPKGLVYDMEAVFEEYLDQGGSTETFRDHLNELGIEPLRVAGQVSQFKQLKFIGGEAEDMRVALPLKEGTAFVAIPAKLSPASADTLRDWLDHLIKLASSGERK